jgi:hypothetical protein
MTVLTRRKWETPMAKRGRRQGRISFHLSARARKALEEARKNATIVKVVGRVTPGGVLEIDQAGLAAIGRRARTKGVAFIALNAPFKTRALTL